MVVVLVSVVTIHIGLSAFNRLHEVARKDESEKNDLKEENMRLKKELQDFRQVSYPPC